MSEYIVGNDGDESILDIGEFELRFQEREEIVRCRDCRWFDSRFNYQLCRRDMSCDEIAVSAEPDGFCKWGERRLTMTSQLNYGPVYHNNSEWPTHIWAGRPSDGETRCYVEQRTCADVGKAAVFKCSECGWASTVFSFGEGMPVYCPNCGAKVVK